MPKWIPSCLRHSKGGKLFEHGLMLDLAESGHCYGLGLVWCELAVATAWHRARSASSHAERSPVIRHPSPAKILVLLACQLHARRERYRSHTFSSFSALKYFFRSKSKSLNALHRRIRAYQGLQGGKFDLKTGLELQAADAILRRKNRELAFIEDRVQRIRVQVESLRKKQKEDAALLLSYDKATATHQRLIEELEVALRAYDDTSSHKTADRDFSRIPTLDAHIYGGWHNWESSEIEVDKIEEVNISELIEGLKLGGGSAGCAELYALNLKGEGDNHIVFIQAPPEESHTFLFFCANLGEIKVERESLGKFLAAYMTDFTYRGFSLHKLDFNVDRCLAVTRLDLEGLIADDSVGRSLSHF